jgi:hypothetical protein
MGAGFSKAFSIDRTQRNLVILSIITSSFGILIYPLFAHKKGAGAPYNYWFILPYLLLVALSNYFYYLLFGGATNVPESEINPAASSSSGSNNNTGRRPQEQEQREQQR